MIKRQKRAALAPILAVFLGLQGCALLGTGTDNLKVPANVKAYAGQVPRIRMTSKIPTKEELCDMQREHAKQEAFLDGTIEGTKTVYVADCDMKKPAKPKATS